MVGSDGQSCTDACANAGTRCTNALHGSSTYGMDIALEAVRQSGLPLRVNDEFQNNLRVRDGYEVRGGDYYAVPGFWRTDEGKADVNWKNPNFTGMPSRCEARWSAMRRVCACDP